MGHSWLVSIVSELVVVSWGNCGLSYKIRLLHYLSWQIIKWCVTNSCTTLIKAWNITTPTQRNTTTKEVWKDVTNCKVKRNIYINSNKVPKYFKTIQMTAIKHKNIMTDNYSSYHYSVDSLTLLVGTSFLAVRRHTVHPVVCLYNGV